MAGQRTRRCKARASSPSKPARPLLNDLWEIAARAGLPIVEKDREEILALADGIADPYVGQLVRAFADALPSGGIKDIEWGAIKGALLASIPSDEQATNAQISSLFDRIVAALGATNTRPA
jgi:hypothetical protein